MDKLKIENLAPIENEGKRILLTSQLAKLYGTTDKVISNNFNRNIERYQEGKDYYCLEDSEKRRFINLHQIEDGSKNAKTLYLWTEHGALLHAKSLGTNEAWKIYGDLVDTYFRVQESKKLSAIERMRLHDAAIYELDERVDVLEEKIDKQITLDCGKQRTLQNVISHRVYEHAGQVFPKSIKENVGRFFQAIYRDLKNRFGVASYRDINVTDYANAIAYVEAWIEPAEVRNEVS